MEEIIMTYDLIIVGAGPAGLAAGIYAGRYMLNTLIIEKAQDGGQISQTAEIENYPGLRTDVEESGLSLTERMTEQVKRFGAERVLDDIVSYELSSDVKKLTGLSGRTYEARAVILAMGAHYRSIGCKNEDKFRGMGISFCATCDANFFRGLDVYVAGGGDSAIEEAIYLTKFARKVTVIHRRDQLRAAKSIQEKAFANDKLHFIWDSVVDEACGTDVLSGLVIRNVKTGELTRLDADPADGMIGLFGFLGMIPNTEGLEDSGIELADGYIAADETTRTNITGVFAAGDIRKKELRQVVTAVSDGAVAAFQAERYLAG
ncbi:MAG TPA: thioredoxin-disulfide reductase [Candidatus Avilachnospira avicola]|nr:thioredoxin-disulfide reductase [Candidatus Avilachnospira avicola]